MLQEHEFHRRDGGADVQRRHRRRRHEERTGEAMTRALRVERRRELAVEHEVPELVREREALPIAGPVRAHDDHRMCVDATREPVESAVADLCEDYAHAVRLNEVGDIRDRPIAERPRITDALCLM